MTNKHEYVDIEQELSELSVTSCEGVDVAVCPIMAVSADESVLESQLAAQLVQDRCAARAGSVIKLISRKTMEEMVRQGARLREYSDIRKDLMDIYSHRIAHVAEWQTHSLQERAPQGVRVRLPP